MSKVKPAYSAEFRRQAVELMRVRHTPAEFSRELSVYPEHARATTIHTVHIRKCAPRFLFYEVLTSNGELLARSVPFRSICILEAALSVLTEVASLAEDAVIEFDGNTTWIKARSKRSRVALEGGIPVARAFELLAGLHSALVVDDRSPNERRTDLSGRLCDLNH